MSRLRDALEKYASEIVADHAKVERVSPAERRERLIVDDFMAVVKPTDADIEAALRTFWARQSAEARADYQLGLPTHADKLRFMRIRLAYAWNDKRPYRERK